MINKLNSVNFQNHSKKSPSFSSVQVLCSKNTIKTLEKTVVLSNDTFKQFGIEYAYRVGGSLRAPNGTCGIVFDGVENNSKRFTDKFDILLVMELIKKGFNAFVTF